MKHVSKNISIAALAVLLAGCSGNFSSGINSAGKPRPDTQDAAKSASGQNEPRPKARPSGLNAASLKPSKAARTVEQFDTTSKEQRAKAVKMAVPEKGERKLGKTIGTLGDPTQPGFWLKTPLVNAPAKGRVKYPATGKSVAVDLIPIDGLKTAGSRVSLAALRLLGAPLTGLPELIVYRD
jgi:hypothetical protein